MNLLRQEPTWRVRFKEKTVSYGGFHYEKVDCKSMSLCILSCIKGAARHNISCTVFSRLNAGSTRSDLKWTAEALVRGTGVYLSTSFQCISLIPILHLVLNINRLEMKSVAFYSCLSYVVLYFAVSLVNLKTIKNQKKFGYQNGWTI